jgi:two-component system cell cycle sensor histidine kinase/response regulator CckA
MSGEDAKSNQSFQSLSTADAARLLTSFLWIQVAGFVVYVGIEAWVDPQRLGRYLLQASLAGSFIVALMLLVRAGRVRTAAIGCVLSAWAVFSASAYTGGGIRGSATLGYLVAVLAAGLLLGEVASAVTAGACILTGLFLVMLEVSGRLPPSGVSNAPLDFWANLSIFCALTVALQALANRSLRASERRYRLLVERARDAIFTLTSDGSLASVNPAFENMTGWRTPELLGTPFTELLATPIEKSTWTAFLEAPEAAQRHSLELLVRRADGGAITLELNLAPSRDPNVATLGIGRDVTERKQEEEKRATFDAQLRQSQKLEAIGTLAGGIAHDFNNVLTAIIGYAQLLQDDAAAGTAAQQNSGEILKAGVRARDVVRQLLTFAKSNVSERRNSRVQVVVREALQLMRASIPASIEMHVKLDAAAPAVLADPTQMHQVVVNLVTNAAAAMRDHGGHLTVLLEALEVGKVPTPSSPPLPEGRYVRLSVADTGHGMDAHVQERIFEPFFTTKPEGEGTGLGLAVVHSIIQDHEGSIVVHSTPGAGTTLDVYLPALSADVAPASAQPLGALPQGRGERLLIIDDEPAIGRVLGKQLERLGYRVTTSTDPEAALELLIEDPMEFDLAITDLQMPHMNGVELAARIAAVSPGLPVVLITGNRQSVQSSVVRAAGVREVVDKPFQIRELGRAVRAALDGAKSEKDLDGTDADGKSS